MHELTLAQEILRIVEVAAEREHVRQVATLRLEAGALACVEVSALRFALDAIVSGTCLDGAAIEIDEPPGMAWCKDCAAEMPIGHLADCCPRCGATGLTPTGGGALRVLEVLVREN